MFAPAARPLHFSLNVTLDGCYDHTAGIADDELHRRATASIEKADALLFGRVIYQMMESAWRQPTPPDAWPEWMMPFALTIDRAKKYVVSSTLESVDWNSELVRGDLATAVKELKSQPGNGLLTGGVTLPKTLAELGLIDEYELVVHPRIAGHGPTLLAGLPNLVDLEPVSRVELGSSGTVAITYVPKH